MKESYYLKETEDQLQNAAGSLQRIYELGSKIQTDLAKNDFRKIRDRLSEIQAELQEADHILKDTNDWGKMKNMHEAVSNKDCVEQIKILLNKITEMDGNIINEIQKEQSRVIKELKKLSRSKDSLHGYDKNFTSNFHEKNNGHKLQVVR